MRKDHLRRKAIWIPFALTLMLGLAAGMIQRTRRVKVTTNVARVEADIREHVPVGSSRADVASYLDQRGIQHSYIDQSKGEPEYSTEMAMVPGASRSLLIRGDIQILFKFDNQARLTHYSVHEIFTGP
jgi:hypothetical protein